VIEYEGNNYVKLGGQWYWAIGESLEAEYRLEAILDGLVPESGEVTEAERERLVILMEECGEVIQACSKIIRHGWHSRYDDGTPNVIRLRDEMDDVQGMIWAIEQESDDVLGESLNSPSQVWERKKRRMHHQK
jgi:NTP pyrophosphatase (non-canonical NTP hydrolase)